MNGVFGAVAVTAAAAVVGWPRLGAVVRERLTSIWLPRPVEFAARLRHLLHQAPRLRSAIVLAFVAGTGAWALAGPVAAVVAGTYGGLALRAVVLRAQRRAAAVARARGLDHLADLAAEVRAGLPAPTGARMSIVDIVEPLRARAAAAVRLAEATGAPLAELFERIEADGRAADRAAATAAAQSAGARATVWLLAVLPVAGLAIGYGVGADPLAVLLHTPLGAGCAIGALGLQVAGLAWVHRLVDGPADRRSP